MSADRFGPSVGLAIRQAAVRVDARGLVPVEDARAHLARIASFDGDVTWAALLSLADAAEAVAECRRLRWDSGPRRPDDIALVERYGEGILPWLADHVDVDGVLWNVPWNVAASLEVLGSPQAFELVWRVRAVVGGEESAPRADGAGGGDPGRAERVGATGQEAARALFLRWLSRNPHVGYPELGRRAWHGDESARAVLRKAAPHPPELMHRWIAAVAGPDATAQLFAMLGLLATPPDGISRAQVLAQAAAKGPEQADATRSWPVAPPDVHAFDGEWVGPDGVWCIRIEGLAGVVVSAPGIAPGEVGLRILKVSSPGFEFLGEERLSTGTFAVVTGLRVDAFTIRVNAAGVVWDMKWRAPSLA